MRLKLWRSGVVALASLAVPIVLAGCSPAGGVAHRAVQVSRLASDQTIRFPINSDIGTFDPAQIDSVVDASFATNIFDGLLKFNNQYKIVPDIASSLPTVSSNGLIYTFHLRHDARFWNGDPVTASDFIFSWDRAASGQGAFANELSSIVGFDAVSAPHATLTQMSGLSAPSPHTLVVTLTAPSGLFLTQVADFAIATAVVDPKVVSADPTTWWTVPGTLVGSGPYRMTARTPGKSLTFTAVKNWWGSPKPTVKTIQVTIMASLTTAIAKYEQGGFDLIGYGGQSSLPPSEVLRIKRGPKREASQLHTYPLDTSFWVEFNFKTGPFTGLTGPGEELRRAFSLAIDRKQLIAVACEGGLTCSEETGGVISRGLVGYLGNNTNPLDKFDPSEARRLLHKADPTGSKTRNLTFVIDVGEFNATVVSNLQSQWQKNLGVRVNIQTQSTQQYFAGQLSFKYPLSEGGWQADYNNPYDWFTNLWDCGAGSSENGYCNPQVDALAQKAVKLPLSEGIPLYHKAERLMIDDAAYAPLIYLVGQYLVKPYVRGVGENNFVAYSWVSLKVLKH